MKLTKQQALDKIEKLEAYVAGLDKEPKMAQEPDWGYKAKLTEKFLSQTMTLNGVEYHRHKHGGGWVSEKAKVDETVWVGPLAIIHNGVVKDQAVIHDNAEVNCDDLQAGAEFNIGDSARVFDSALVFGSAWVFGSAMVCDFARVSDLARVFGSAQVFGLARVFGSARVYGQGHLKKDTYEDIRLKDGQTVE